LAAVLMKVLSWHEVTGGDHYDATYPTT
jgi:hypothetical protein